jgi:putative hydrolase of the HAD superfamily
MSTIRTVFFDFGNVIAFFDHERTTRALLPHTDVRYEDLYRAVYHPTDFDAFESGHLPSDGYVDGVFARVSLRCDRKYFEAVFADIFEPNPAVCELIPQLARTHRLVLASNTNGLHAGLFLKTLKPTFDYFHTLVMSHEAKARKPDAKFYAYCQQFAVGAPHECLFIDDRADNIEAARRHGWQTIQYTDHAVLLRELARLGVYNNGQS